MGRNKAATETLVTVGIRNAESMPPTFAFRTDAQITEGIAIDEYF
jgi:hypothetical protein